MTIDSIKNLIVSTLSDFGAVALVILTAVIVVAISFYLYRFGVAIVTGTSFTGWAWLDRHTYKPYKGYNRWRSRQWNMQHTMN